MDPNTLINELLDRSRYIRAIGPTTDDFMRWRDAAEELLTDLLDEDHPALAQYRAAIGPRERIDAEGLQIHGPFGMAPRLEAAEAVLSTLTRASGD